MRPYPGCGSQPGGSSYNASRSLSKKDHLSERTRTASRAQRRRSIDHDREAHNPGRQLDKDGASKEQGNDTHTQGGA